MKTTHSNSAGMWIAIVLVVAGVLAGVAEWRFRPPASARPPLNPSEPMPATQP